MIEPSSSTSEDKADTKDVHWGLFKRPYLESVDITYGGNETWGKDEKTEYHIVRNPQDVYEPLICAIESAVIYVFFALKLKLYGRISPDDGFMVVDALYLNEDRIEEIKDFFTNGIGFDYFDDIKHYNFDYRIYEKPENIEWSDKDNLKVLYKSYKDLKSRNSVYCKRYYDSHKKNK